LLSSRLWLVYEKVIVDSQSILNIFLVYEDWSWLLAFGFWLLAFGFWLLAFGFWLLAFGFWLLAFGFWLLAFGFWPYSSLQ
jgi:hypothetical protein